MIRFLMSLSLVLVALGCETKFDDSFCPTLDGCVSESESSGSYSEFFFDDFNRSAESPLASPWSFISGSGGDDMELRSSAVYPKRGAGNSPAAIYTSSVDDNAVKITVTATITGAAFPAATPGEIFVWGRVLSTSSLDNGYFCGIDPGSGVVTVGKYVSNTATALGSSTGSFTHNNGDSFAITFTLANSDITCSIVENSTTTLSVTLTDTSFTTGYSGIGGGKNGADELSFDDFRIESASL